jgi:hypothetical protein
VYPICGIGAADVLIEVILARLWVGWINVIEPDNGLVLRRLVLQGLILRYGAGGAFSVTLGSCIMKK